MDQLVGAEPDTYISYASLVAKTSLSRSTPFYDCPDYLSLRKDKRDISLDSRSIPDLFLRIS